MDIGIWFDYVFFPIWFNTGQGWFVGQTVAYCLRFFSGYSSILVDYCLY